MSQWLEQYHNALIIALAAALAAGIAFFVAEQQGGPAPLVIVPDGPTPGGAIEVHITGAVVHPGVYELTDGARVVDVLNEAGGAAPEADLEAVNLAQRLSDEDQVVVPRMGESRSQVAAARTDLIDINTASAQELDDVLPGIGEVYSQRIIDSREADGPFRAPEELLERGLIPSHTYDQIRELITVGR